MQTVHTFIQWLNGYLWGPPMLILLLGTHVFLTIRLRFIQRYLGLAIRISFQKDKKGEGDVSQFGSLATALAATLGTGNIVGVATAVALGGPGAVLWMWLTGVFGIATKYAEALIAVKYRIKTENGTMLGGPMYALAKGLNLKWLAVLFCIFTALAAFGIGNMVQANALSTLAQDTLHVNPYLTGIVLALLTAVVIIGGVKAIARVCTQLVPVMALFYILGCLIILVINIHYVFPAVALIVRHALTPQAAGGGFAGASVLMIARYGIARGLFSNESGLGSAPIVAAAAQTNNPVRQALVSASGTFWDTVIVCALTGLVLVSSMLKSPGLFDGLNGPQLSKTVFDQIPVIGPVVLTGGLVTFVFSTILGWSYYGERAVEYLVGRRGIIYYRYLWILVVFLGAVATVPFVWDFSDTMNALMAIPNLVSLFLLNGVILSETRRYLWRNEIGGSA